MANTFQFGRRALTIIPDGSTAVNLITVQSGLMPVNTIVGDFVVGETVTQATSGATGKVQKWQSNMLYLNQTTGIFDTTHVVTGGTSAAHAIPSYVGPAFPYGMRLSAVRFTPSGAGDRLIIRGQALPTGPILFDLFAVTAADLVRSVGGRSLKEKLYILESECVFSAAASAVIVLEYE